MESHSRHNTGAHIHTRARPTRVVRTHAHTKEAHTQQNTFSLALSSLALNGYVQILLQVHYDYFSLQDPLDGGYDSNQNAARAAL